MRLTDDGLTAVTANYASRNLSVVDLAGKSVTRWIDVGFRVDSLAITPDGRYAIASSASTSNSVVLVDLVAGTVDATLTGINYFPRDVAISDDGTQAYAVTTGLTDSPDSLYFIDVDGASSSVAGSIPIGDASGGMYDYTRLQLSPDGSLLAIPVTGSGDLVLVDTTTRAEIARVATGAASPTEVLFSPDGSLLFVRHQSGNGLSAIRIDGANSNLQTVITEIPSPAAMTIDAAGDYLYVATSLYRRNNEVHVVDVQSLDVVQTVSLSSDARPTRMHHDGNVIYLLASEEFTPRVFAADASDTLMRIFAAGVDSELVDATPLGGRSRLVSYSPPLQSALAASQDQDTIEVIDFSDTTFGDEDYYQFLPQVGDTLTLATTIPGSADGLIENALDVAIEVFDPQGRRIGVGESGTLQITIGSIGIHTVRVFAQNFTRGEYVLSIDGATIVAGPSLVGFTPSGAADADDVTISDDEDGVAFGSLQVGQIDASFTMDVRNVTSEAYLDAWIDFNADGHFGGKAEQVAASVTVGNGNQIIEFDVPAWVSAGETFARVRLSTAGGLGVTGNAPDGEVEDYWVEIEPPRIASREFYPLKSLSPKFSGGNVVPVDLDSDVNDDGLSWYEQTATGWTQHAIATGFHYAVEIFDVNSDGVLDVVSADSFQVNWYENDAAGSFTKRLLINISSVRAVEFADLDGDGDMDAIAKGTNSFSDLSWLENDGAQNFQLRTLSDKANQAIDLATADLDGDSDLDVVVSTSSDGFAWIENVNGVLLSVEELTPSAGSAMVAPGQDLAIRFDQVIQLGSGRATIHLAVDDSIVETIDVTSSNVSLSGDTLTLDPLSDLAANTRYYVRLDAGVVKNVPGDPYEGLDDERWNFQTAAIGIDYGDAPDTAIGTSAGNYNTLATDNGPSHVLTAGLYLGRIADADDGTLQNAWAGADDAVGAPDDENSVLAADRDLVLTVAASPTVALVVTNLTDGEATLSGWIDYNRNGVFEANESAQTTVFAGTRQAIVTLPFPPVPGGSAGETFARFRLGTDAAAQSPVGPSGPGEVEDYPVTIRNPGLGTAASATVLSSGIGGVPLLDASDQFGASVAALGDLDGDGIDDIAIGAPGDDDLALDAGAVYIAMMNADGSIKSHQKIIADATGLPFDASDQFGMAIAPAGDLDFDGVADLYVMSKQTGNQTASISRVTLNADGTVKEHTYMLATVPGGFPQLSTFAPIGDLDGDGNPDFAIGENFVRVNNVFSGALHILFSADDGSARETTLIASQIGGGPSLTNSAYFGTSVTSLGDIDGDGVTDLAVGAYGNRSVTTNSGAVYILFMKRDGTVKSSYEINGTNPNEPALGSLSQFGSSVAAIGDLDSSGVAELLVGANGHAVGETQQAGQAFVLYLASDGSVVDHVALGTANGGVVHLAESDFFGRSVAAAGDINGDGHVDLVVGSSPTSSSNRGRVHTILLDAPTPPGVQTIQVNDGGNGRSQLTSLVVSFDAIVDHQGLTDAFIVTNTDSETDVGQVTVTADDSGGTTVVQIGFAGASTVARAGSGTLANSLSDGNYRLLIEADKIRTADGTAMASDHVWGQQNVDAFFRLFGDTDGDRDVDGQDYGRFGLRFLKSGTDPAFDPQLDGDGDGDGDVDGQDYGRFGQNFLKRLGDVIR